MLHDQDIVCFASSSYFARSWVNVQHIMSRLAGANRVLYVESVGLRAASCRSSTDLKRIGRRVRHFLGGLVTPQKGLAVLSPFGIPFVRSAPVERLNRRLLLSQVRKAMSRLGFHRPIVWTFLPLGLDWAQLTERSLLVYHCVDDYGANPGVNAETVARNERRLLRAADLVLTTSRSLFEEKGSLNRNTCYTPSVADTAIFRPGVPPHPAVALLDGGPRVGYVGNIAHYKMDLDLVR